VTAMGLLPRRRTRRQQRDVLPATRPGISLIEIMVALLLFGSVSVAMSGLSLVVARRADANDLSTKRSAALQQQMNRLQALPYDSLASKAGIVTVSDGAFPHKRRITVSSAGSRTRVTIQIIPTKAPATSESIAFDRARPTTSPLCKGC
jgi:Tfp pilus assembly protein PilV